RGLVEAKVAALMEQGDPVAARSMRTVASLLAVLATAVGLVAARPAGVGIEVPILYPRGPALTWVGDDGSQYVVTSIMTSIAPPAGAFDLVIARVLPNGTPDPS